MTKENFREIRVKDDGFLPSDTVGDVNKVLQEIKWQREYSASFSPSYLNSSSLITPVAVRKGFNWWNFFKWLLISLLALLLIIILLLSLSRCTNEKYENRNSSLTDYWQPDDSTGDSGDTTTNDDADSGDGTTSTGSTVDKDGTEVTGDDRGIVSVESWQDWDIAGVDDIITKTTMTDYAKLLFLHAAPRLVDEDKFDDEHYCGAKRDHSTGEVLGCYYEPKDGEAYTSESGETGNFAGRGDDYIFIKKFNDRKLVNDMYVTSAHEMLHAAFYRLTTSDEKTSKRVLEMLYKEYGDNENLKTRMQVYIDGGLKEDSIEFLNELHSIIGTEVTNISPELEEYYKVYFNNRKSLVKKLG
jgi:hypothetical protein